MKFLKEYTKPVIIAEIGLAHDGSVGNCIKLIEQCKNNGADIIKFQIHFAEEESTLDEKFRIKFSFEDNTRYDYWKRTSFTENQWLKIFNFCKKKKIKFFASVFSLKAFNLVYSFGVRCFKLSSGEVFNNQILNEILKKRCELIISNGLSDEYFLNKLLKRIKKRSKFALLECTTKYPSPPENINIRNTVVLGKKYKCLSGLSDHSGKIYPSISALTLGANIIEVHICFNKNMFGPDISSSLDLSQLQQLIEARNFIFSMKNFKKKDVDVKKFKNLFGRSLAFKKNKFKNQIITLNDLVLKKPGNGIQESMVKKIVGKKLKKDVKNNRLLSLKDINFEK